MKILFLYLPLGDALHHEVEHLLLDVGKTTVLVLYESHTVLVLHDAQLLNKQLQIWDDVYIHWHFSSGTDTVVLPRCVGKFLKTVSLWTQKTFGAHGANVYSIHGLAVFLMMVKLFPDVAGQSTSRWARTGRLSMHGNWDGHDNQCSRFSSCQAGMY